MQCVAITDTEIYVWGRNTYNDSELEQHHKRALAPMSMAFVEELLHHHFIPHIYNSIISGKGWVSHGTAVICK